jgi:hypothetical protein
VCIFVSKQKVAGMSQFPSMNQIGAILRRMAYKIWATMVTPITAAKKKANPSSVDFVDPT